MLLSSIFFVCVSSIMLILHPFTNSRSFSSIHLIISFFTSDLLYLPSISFLYFLSTPHRISSLSYPPPCDPPRISSYPPLFFSFSYLSLPIFAFLSSPYFHLVFVTSLFFLPYMSLHALCPSSLSFPYICTATPFFIH